MPMAAKRRETAGLKTPSWVADQSGPSFQESWCLSGNPLRRRVGRHRECYALASPIRLENDHLIARSRLRIGGHQCHSIEHRHQWVNLPIFAEPDACFVIAIALPLGST